jgi:uncharacterized membrane protein YphA (DoxX/SURF4 family)
MQDVRLLSPTGAPLCQGTTAFAPSSKELVSPRKICSNGRAYLSQDTGRRHTMNILLWVLQALAALLYGASGVMKVFMFDKVSEDVPSFGALPREAWMALGILELVCTVGLIVPAAFHWKPALTVVAATVLAIESLVFVGVHAKYHEITPIILSGVLGLLMAFIAYGRMVLKPIL